MIILSFQCFLGERVAGVRIKAGRDTDELGLEFLQLIESGSEYFSVFLARGMRRNRVIEAVFADVARAGTRIAGKLMDREKCRASPIQQDIFGTIPVMDVEIVNRDSFDARG